MKTDSRDTNSVIMAGDGGLVTTPNINTNDVLSGRGGRINNHRGNIQFRELVKERKHQYLSKLTKKMDKIKIAHEIVYKVRNMNPPGRFLKEQDGMDSGVWMEIGDEKARKKCGQAMREGAPETRRELEEIEKQEIVSRSIEEQNINYQEENHKIDNSIISNQQIYGFSDSSVLTHLSERHKHRVIDSNVMIIPVQEEDKDLHMNIPIESSRQDGFSLIQSSINRNEHTKVVTFDWEISPLHSTSSLSRKENVPDCSLSSRNCITSFSPFPTLVPLDHDEHRLGQIPQERHATDGSLPFTPLGEISTPSSIHDHDNHIPYLASDLTSRNYTPENIAHADRESSYLPQNLMKPLSPGNETSLSIHSNSFEFGLTRSNSLPSILSTDFMSFGSLEDKTKSLNSPITSDTEMSNGGSIVAKPIITKHKPVSFRNFSTSSIMAMSVLSLDSKKSQKSDIFSWNLNVPCTNGMNNDDIIGLRTRCHSRSISDLSVDFLALDLAATTDHTFLSQNYNPTKDNERNVYDYILHT